MWTYFALVVVPMVNGLGYGTWQPYAANQPLDKVVCSNGENGLITRWHYNDLSQMFPYVTAISDGTGRPLPWNSPECGKCMKLTDVQSKSSIFVTVVDAVPPTPGYDMHYNIAEDAFKKLFGDAGIQAGHGQLTFEEADFHNCPGNRGTSAASTCDNDCALYGESYSCRSRVEFIKAHGVSLNGSITEVNDQCQPQCSCSASDFGPSPSSAPEQAIKEPVKCCCEGCSPAGCIASIDSYPKLSSADQCATAQPGIHGFCNNSTQIYHDPRSAGSSYCKAPSTPAAEFLI